MAVNRSVFEWVQPIKLSSYQLLDKYGFKRNAVEVNVAEDFERDAIVVCMRHRSSGVEISTAVSQHYLRDMEEPADYVKNALEHLARRMKDIIDPPVNPGEVKTSMPGGIVYWNPGVKVEKIKERVKIRVVRMGKKKWKT